MANNTAEQFIALFNKLEKWVKKEAKVKDEDRFKKSVAISEG